MLATTAKSINSEVQNLKVYADSSSGLISIGSFLDFSGYRFEFVSVLDRKINETLLDGQELQLRFSEYLESDIYF